MTMLDFEEIAPDAEQIDLLYQLLAARNHGISHRSMPSFRDHSAFVRDHPYRAWYLIREAGRCIGSTYLQSDNSVGVDLTETRLADCLQPVLEWITASFEPLPAIASVRAGQFSINVAPDNRPLIDALEKQGFRIAQLTYAIDP